MPGDVVVMASLWRYVFLGIVGSMWNSPSLEAVSDVKGGPMSPDSVLVGDSSTRDFSCFSDPKAAWTAPDGVSEVMLPCRSARVSTCENLVSSKPKKNMMACNPKNMVNHHHTQRQP